MAMEPPLPPPEVSPSMLGCPYYVNFSFENGNIFWEKTEVVTIWAQDRFRGRSSPFQETGWQKIGTGPERKIQSCINRISWWEPYLEQWRTSGNI